MGAYLSQPNTTKTSSDGGNGNLSYGFSAMQGWRVSMEVKLKKKINIRSQPTNVEVCNWTPGMFVVENYSNLKKICTQLPKVSLLMFSPTRGRDLLFETFLCCFINARNKNVLLIDGCKHC